MNDAVIVFVIFIVFTTVTITLTYLDVRLQKKIIEKERKNRLEEKERRLHHAVFTGM